MEDGFVDVDVQGALKEWAEVKVNWGNHFGEHQLKKEAPMKPCKRHAYPLINGPRSCVKCGYVTYRDYRARKSTPEDLLVLAEKERGRVTEAARQGRSLSFFSTISNTGYIDQSLGRVCYMDLQLANMNEDGYAYLVDNPFCFSYKKKNTEQRIEAILSYVHWVINDSIWAVNFLTKDADDAYENGVILCLDKPGHFVVQGMVALRYVSEFPETIWTWYRLIEMGASPHFAIMMAHDIKPVSTLNVFDRDTGFAQFALHNSNHSMFSGEPSVSQIQRMEAKIPLLFPDETPMSECLEYTGLDSSIGSRRERRMPWRRSLPQLAKSGRKSGRKNTLGQSYEVTEISTENVQAFIEANMERIRGKQIWQKDYDAREYSS